MDDDDSSLIFWDNAVFHKVSPVRRWLDVFKSHNDVSLDPDDEKAVVSLMRHLWNKKQSFVLVCGLDDDGRVTIISDDDDDNRIGKEYIAFASNSRRNDNVLFRLNEEELCIDDDSDNASVDLPRLGSFFSNAPSKSLEAISSWMIDKKLSRFWDLQLYGDDEGEGDNKDEFIEDCLSIIHALDFRVTKNLKRLAFGSPYKFKGNHLETLCVDILPNFPNLATLALCDNDPDTNPNWIRFPKTFNTISRIAFDIDDHMSWESPKDNDLIYALITNHMGRRLFDCNHGDGNSVDPTRIGTNTPRLPDSVWPLVLERAKTLPSYSEYTDRSNETIEVTGIYYLLREIPALLHRHTPDRLPGVSNGKRKNDSTERLPPSKEQRGIREKGGAVK